MNGDLATELSAVANSVDAVAIVFKEVVIDLVGLRHNCGALVRRRFCERGQGVR